MQFVVPEPVSTLRQSVIVWSYASVDLMAAHKKISSIYRSWLRVSVLT